MLKIIILSDLHLVPEGRVSNGLDTAERFRLAVESINRDHADADICLLAGDLADRGEAAAYTRLRDLLVPLAVPHHITLGNHDDRPVFLDVFGSHEADENGHVNKVIDAKGYRIILLDSSEPGVVSGILCEKRLAWLHGKLEEARDRPVIVVLHHHANDLFLPVDTIKLENAGDFIAVLKTHPDIRQVIAGHVHITTTGLYHGIAFTTLAGSHYNVSLHLDSVPGEQKRLEGPAQYAVVLATEEATVVHFHDYIDRHLELAPALFGQPRNDP
jgi:3',5'-cyclic AMP phosphodiesterase CpdA